MRLIQRINKVATDSPPYTTHPMKVQTNPLFAFCALFFTAFSISCFAQSSKNEPVHVQAVSNTTLIPQEDSIQAPNGIYVVVDEMPEFPGGTEKMVNFIIQHTHLPVEPNANTKGAEVHVQFIVEKDGSLSDIKVIQGFRKGYDDECKRVFGTMPKWNPGKKGRHLVRTLMMIPLKFS